MRPVWTTSRGSRREQVQRRLATVASGWVPTAASVEQELSGSAGEPAGPSAPGATTVSWDDAAPAAPSPRIDRTVLPSVVLVVVGALLGSAVLWLLAWPRGVAAGTPTGVPWSTGSPAPTATGSPGPTIPPTATDVVVVDVEGAVRRPGVFELPTGSRVVDAVDAAGGTLRRADTTPLNLARILTDGEQVLVPTRGGGGPVSVPTVPGAPTAPAQIDLNTATMEDLDALPGIGPVLAQRILDWRTANGGFTSVDQLQDVSGIGDATFADLAPLVRV